jgi:hypothetical protein
MNSATRWVEEATVKPHDLWIVGTALSRTVGIPRSTLQDAVRSGAIVATKLGSGQTVVVWRDVCGWIEGRQ